MSKPEEHSPVDPIRGSANSDGVIDSVTDGSSSTWSGEPLATDAVAARTQADQREAVARAQNAANGMTGGVANGATTPTTITRTGAVGSGATRSGSATATSAATASATAASAAMANRRDRIEKVEWERNRKPIWPWIAGSVGLMSVLAGVHATHTKSTVEEKLRQDALQKLKAIPGVNVKFDGRDATITGVSPADRKRAHDLVRNITGVRHVEEKVLVPKPVAAPATTIVLAEPTLLELPTTTLTPPPTTAAPTTVAPSTAAPSTEAPTTAAPTTRVPATLAPTTVPATLAPVVGSVTSDPSSTIAISGDGAAQAPPSANLPGGLPTTTEFPTKSAPASAPEVPVPGDLPTLVLFGYADNSLDAAARQSLDQTVAYMNQNEGIELFIGGHTDSVGTKLGNLAISKHRAQSVKDYLVSKGIAESRIRVLGYGSRFPVADNGTEIGQKLNRRAELQFAGINAGEVTFTG